jgi:hypothetical protein
MTREALYDLMWSKTATEIAKDCGVSGTAIAKVCQRFDIPRPPAGYWNKVHAGKRVHRQPLARRSPGMSDEITIGGGPYSYGYGRTSDEERAASNPQPPVFEDEMVDVRRRVSRQFKNSQFPTTLEKPHRLIRRYLDEDEERRKKMKKSGYSWDAPLFDDPFERRRLTIISALFTVAEQHGFKPYITGKEARSLGIKVHDQEMSFLLDATSQTPNHWGQISMGTRGESSKMRLRLGSEHQKKEPEVSWEDHGRSLIETKLRDILIELVVGAEQHHRDWMQHKYEWAVEAKARAIKDLQKKKEEEERLERERLIALEQARIDRLLEGAAALKRANDIRAYVRSVSERFAAEPELARAEDFAAWQNWANAQADRIDPVIGGRFVDEIEDRSLP